MRAETDLLRETRPLDANAWRLLALRFLEEHRLEEAIDAAGRAQLNCSPKNSALTLQVSGLVEALAEHEAAVGIQLRMAKTCVHADLIDRAIVHTEIAVQKRPEDVAAQHLLSNLYWRVGRRDEAVDTLNFLLWHYPDDVEIAMALAERLVDCTRTKSAMMIINRIRDKIPPTGAGELRIGRLQRQCGEAEAACWRLEKAVALASDDAGAHYELALAYVETGRLHPAVAELEETVFLKGDWNEPLRKLIQVYKDLDMPDEAADAEKRLAARPTLTVDVDIEDEDIEDEDFVDESEITGRLRLIPVPELLQFLAQRKLTGVLRVTTESGSGSIEIYEGTVVGAELSDRPALQQQLLAQQIVTQETLEASGLELGEQGAAAFCAALVEWDLADPRVLRDVCRDHCETVLAELINWSEGQIDFVSAALYKTEPQIRFDVQGLLLDTMRKIDEAAR